MSKELEKSLSLVQWQKVTIRKVMAKVTVGSDKVIYPIS